MLLSPWLPFKQGILMLILYHIYKSWFCFPVCTHYLYFTLVLIHSSTFSSLSTCHCFSLIEVIGSILQRNGECNEPGFTSSHINIQASISRDRIPSA